MSTPARSRLTDAQYVARKGNVCPACGSSNLWGHSVDVDGATASQPVECLDCDANWNDAYVLTGYTDLQASSFTPDGLIQGVQK